MLCTVFWPSDVKHAGYCFGWTAPAICVAGVIVADTTLEAKVALSALHETKHWEMLPRTCGAPPSILGECHFVGGQAHPVLDFGAAQINFSVVYYDRHEASSLRFYSLEDRNEDGMPPETVIHAKSDHFDFTLSAAPQGCLNLTVINQFNAAKTLNSIIQRRYRQISLWSRLPPSVVHSTLAMLALASSSVSLMARGISAVCNTSLPLIFTTPLLKDFSATIQQIDVRAEQGGYLVHQAQWIPRRESMAIAVFSAQYISFYNSLWLIINDVTLGTAVGSLLCENHQFLADMLNHGIDTVLVDWLLWVLAWLDSWPAGLKLNTELSQFTSHTFIDLITLWSSVLKRVAPYLPSVIYMVGTASCGGFTFAVSLASDMLSLCTAHIYVCYIVSATVYHGLLSTTGSLWNLFRGKRYNVLRNRVDTWEYEIDQLLFGTMLFTLLAFLFPTVIAYYSLFALMRLLIILMHATMETVIAFMNHFPLFALTLRAKDPSRIPGGIYFVVNYRGGIPSLFVKNQPVPFSSIFFQYIRLWSRLSAHYSPVRLMGCVFSGAYLNAIPRFSIRYSQHQTLVHRGRMSTIDQ